MKKLPSSYLGLSCTDPSLPVIGPRCRYLGGARTYAHAATALEEPTLLEEWRRCGPLRSRTVLRPRHRGAFKSHNRHRAAPPLGHAVE
jgi:hypothetical protein